MSTPEQPTQPPGTTGPDETTEQPTPPDETTEQPTTPDETSTEQPTPPVGNPDAE